MLKDASFWIWFVTLVPFSVAVTGVGVAVFGKALRKFPYRPDEAKAFTRPLLPRQYRRCFQTVTRLSPRPRRHEKRRP